MSDLLGWAGLGATIIGLVIAYVTYARRHKKKTLSYVVLDVDRLRFKSAGFAMNVSFNGSEVIDPTTTSIRLLNSGEQPITAGDFESPLAIQLERVTGVLAVDLSARRPTDLDPRLTVRDSGVFIDPLLLNPGDMLELKILSSGYPQKVHVAGRIKDVAKFDRRTQLPYPPGSGAEGQMLGFDKVMWFGLMPAAITSFSAFLVHGLAVRFGANETLSIAFAVVASIAALVLYGLRTQQLVRRRRVWRP